MMVVKKWISFSFPLFQNEFHLSCMWWAYLDDVKMNWLWITYCLYILKPIDENCVKFKHDHIKSCIKFLLCNSYYLYTSSKILWSIWLKEQSLKSNTKAALNKQLVAWVARSHFVSAVAITSIEIDCCKWCFSNCQVYVDVVQNFVNVFQLIHMEKNQANHVT